MHAIYSVAKDHSLSVIRQKGKFGVLYFLETPVLRFALLPYYRRIMELSKILGKLSFTTQAVFPGRIQCRYLQQQQIQVVREINSCQTKKKFKVTGS